MKNTVAGSFDTKEFKNHITQAYAPIRHSLARFAEWESPLGTPLTATDMSVLVAAFDEGMTTASDLSDYIRDTVTNIQEDQFDEMVNFVMVEEEGVKKDLISRLRYSSQYSQYFTETFAAMEAIDVTSDLAYEDAIELLDIAREERDIAINKVFPQIKEVIRECDGVLKRISQDIQEYGEYWQMRGQPFLWILSKDEASVKHPSLVVRKPDLPTWDLTWPDLWKHIFEISITHQISDNRVYELLSEFLLEEMELIYRLRYWYDLKNRYKPFDISPYLTRYGPL